MRRERGVRLVAWIFLLLSGVAAAAPDSPLSAAEVVAALQRGGNIVYFRHADTGPASPEPPTVDLTRCETQRNLNDNGRAQAQEIGRQFRRLRIPVGAVFSSQFCRCKDTAQLAFGRFEVVPTLTGVARGPEFAQARRSASDGLRALLSTAPPLGENTVLISHGFNLIDLEGLYLSVQGEAAIYQSDGAGGYSLLARVLPAEWSELPAAE
jgi:broad specificity phosphatase PhoE